MAGKQGMNFLKITGLGILVMAATGAGYDQKYGGALQTSSAIATWAGDGTPGDDGDGHNRMLSCINQPMEMVFAPDGVSYLLDWNNHRIRRVRPDGTLQTVMGTHLPGDWPCQNPMDPKKCEVPLNGTVPGKVLPLNHPTDMAFAPGGTAYIAAWHNHKVYRFDPSTDMVTVVSGQQKPGFTGDGGPAFKAKLNFPSSLVMDSRGNLFVSDQRNNRIRRIANDPDRTITTVAGASMPPTASGYGGDNGPARSAILALTTDKKQKGADNPPPGGGLAMDDRGNLYISDTFNHCIRKVVPGKDGIIGDGDPAEEIITTVAGTCTVAGFGGDDGPAVRAKLDTPYDIDFGPDGRLYVADTGNNVIRAVDLAKGTIVTVAGSSVAGFSGDGGPAVSAKLRTPYGIAFDAAGHLYILDTMNNRIRLVSN
jgi:sugar lactone lactonase YvrE